MATTPWWRRLLDGIEHEYERRIKAASKVVTYGLPHHSDHDDDDAAAEIVNIPRGTPLRRTAPSSNPASPDEAEHKEA
ncbi:MAG: hypothetical protein HC822_04415 [Oscillochloris sp.]|nr:hypothetical protein [Oscillochloris sp.]